MRAFTAIFLLSWLCTFFMPWWVLFIPAFFVGAWNVRGAFSAFGIGFLAAGLAWLFHALYIHFANDGLLSGRIAEMMGVGSPAVVLLITFLIGGIPGGLGALTGYLLKLNMKPAVVADSA